MLRTTTAGSVSRLLCFIKTARMQDGDEEHKGANR